MPSKQWIIKPRVRSDLVEQILYNRGLSSAEEQAIFIHPTLDQLPDPLSLPGINQALQRLKQALIAEETIIVFGDYDVDGVTSTAILWETLYKLGFKVLPYIPSREEGYGLQKTAIEKFTNEGVTLLITVDCGITSVAEIAFAKKHGIDTIITDHHQPPVVLPESVALVHRSDLAGVGVAWMFASAIQSFFGQKNTSRDFLDLVALGTIADLMPLTGLNRVLVKFGLEQLRRTQHLGLKILAKEAGLALETVGTHEIGYILAPRLNAMGRIHHAIDSLRLLCTRDLAQAIELVKKINVKNSERQELTNNSYEQARAGIINNNKLEKVLIVKSEQWHEGVIGLVAGRLVEEFYRPSIVISLGQTISKGSVRSIPGFNIISALRECESYFVDLGGHPMAAGFSIETVKIEEFENRFTQLASTAVSDDILTASIAIDAEIELTDINRDFFHKLQRLAPFGVGNPEPVFVLPQAEIVSARTVGKNATHLKLNIKKGKSTVIDGIGFGLAEKGSKLEPGNKLDLVFVLSEDSWQNQPRIQIKIKDFKPA